MNILNKINSRRLGSSALFCAITAISAPAAAEFARHADDSWQGPKTYFGVGASAARLDDAKVSDNNISTGDLEDFNDDRVSGQAYVGVMLSSWFGLEAGYLHLPEYDDNGFEIEGHGLSAAALLAAPIGDRAEIYAKGGQVWWDVDVEGPLGFDADIDGEDWFYGGGVNFGLTPNFGIRLEYVRYKLDGGDGEADMDLATVGLNFNF